MAKANRNPISAIKLVAAAAVLIVSAAGSFSPAHAEDCAAADAIAAQHQGKPYREDMLRRMIELCPGHAGALNNLAVILESNDRLDEAEHFYRRAIAAGNAIAPYAGLGDVLAAGGDARGAVAAYEMFLAGLPAEIQRGDPSGLAGYESEYRARLALAMETAGIDPASRPSADPVRGGKFVTAEQIARSLTTKPRRTRGLSLSRRTEPFVDIQIQFDFDSARIRPDSLAQIEEVAKALRDSILTEARILIEGHTDSTGTETYNMELSRRRAASVQRMLAERFGVDGRVTTTKGFGESKPVASNQTAEGQALNRRVTFVNIGNR
ncbi:MAG: OmpA family protein [Alphaproteobacteria bacterium]|jgi:outer membrane protein OmpA-like peptidoglycan-associated protein|nr:OmpA family protein [Alphaproteobacteria bacterium]